MDKPHSYRNFEVEDHVIYLKDKDRRMLCIPNVMIDGRNAREIAISEAHSMLAHLGSSKTVTDFSFLTTSCQLRRCSPILHACSDQRYIEHFSNHQGGWRRHEVHQNLYWYSRQGDIRLHPSILARRASLTTVSKNNEDIFTNFSVGRGINERFDNIGMVRVKISVEDAPEHPLESGHARAFDCASRQQ
jgi:hypothetical protein